MSQTHTSGFSPKNTMNVNLKEMQLMENSRAMQPAERARGGWGTFCNKGDRVSLTNNGRKAVRMLPVEGERSPKI